MSKVAPGEQPETIYLHIHYRFVILEKKPNILYLNTSIRGYPKGLRAGADPRKPIIAVDEHFENVDCKGIAASLMSIEVNQSISSLVFNNIVYFLLYLYAQ